MIEANYLRDAADGSIGKCTIMEFYYVLN